MAQIRTYPKIVDVDPDLLIEHGGLDREAAVYIRSATHASELVEAMLDDRARHMDLAKILAFMLPKRDAVIWACLVSELEESRAGISPLTDQLACARAWTELPSDATARCAYDLAESGGLEDPSGWAALAAFWSGSTLASPDSAVVAPPEHLTGVAVGMAVALSCLSERSRIAINISETLAIGLEIAAGGTGLGAAKQALSRAGSFAA